MMSMEQAYAEPILSSKACIEMQRQSADTIKADSPHAKFYSSIVTTIKGTLCLQHTWYVV